MSKSLTEIADSFINQPQGIRTGFNDLDEITWGLLPQTLTVIGGRSSMGKTGILCDIALSASKEVPVGIMSLEMSRDRLIPRLACNLADLNHWKVKTGKITEQQRDEFIDATNSLDELPIIIDAERPCYFGEEYWLTQREISIEKLFDKRFLRLIQSGCKVIMIDYLQYIAPADPRTKDRRLFVIDIVQKLYNYSVQYNVSIILLSQLSRFEQQYRRKKDPRPCMQDLMESSEIENAADVIILLHRPAVYRKKEIKLTEDTVEKDALFIVAKNRDGQTGDLPVEFHSYSMSYKDLNINVQGEI